MRVKICCISSMEEAETAVGLGAHALGLVSSMPSGPGVIPESLISRIAAQVPAPIDTFLLTSERDPERVIEQHHRCQTTTIQLCDLMTPGSYGRLRAALPGVTLVQVLHVLGPESVQEAERLHAEVDALLLDSGDPNRSVKQLGGTGRTHDWRLSKVIVASSPIPVWLAGGLKTANVAQAITAMRPHGVDLCSGVRTEGRLDPQKLAAFMSVASQFPNSSAPT